MPVVFSITIFLTLKYCNSKHYSNDVKVGAIKFNFPNIRILIIFLQDVRIK